MKISGGNVATALQGPLGWVVVGLVAIGVIYYVGKKIGAAASSAVDAIEAPFKAAGAAIGQAYDATTATVGQGVASYTSSLDANQNATSSDVANSLAVGAAAGG